MSTTTDMAPNRSASRSSRRREADLEEQVAQLQKDLKAIATTLTGLAENKVDEAQHTARREFSHLKAQGRHAVEDVQDEFGAMEKQLKDTIRQKPLTAVAGAVAIGFVLALISR